MATKKRTSKSGKSSIPSAILRALGTSWRAVAKALGSAVRAISRSGGDVDAKDYRDGAALLLLILAAISSLLSLF